MSRNPFSSGPPYDTPWIDPSSGSVSWEWVKWMESPDGPGGVLFGQVRVQTITSATTITPAYNVIIADTSGGAFTITLPSLEDSYKSSISRTFYLKNIGTNTATLDGDGVDVDGESTKTVRPGTSLLIVTDGTEWRTFLLSSETRVEVFEASGTWTRQGESSVTVLLVGPGGGAGGGQPGVSAGVGGGGGGGAGGGEYVVRQDVQVTGDVTVTLGAVGTGGASGANGTAGGTTSFGTITARGGLAGETGDPGSGGGSRTDTTFGSNMSGGSGGASGGGGTGSTPSAKVGLGAPGTGGATAGNGGGGGGGGGSYGAGGAGGAAAQGGGGDDAGVPGATPSSFGGGGGGGGAGVGLGQAGGAGGDGAPSLVIVISTN